MRIRLQRAALVWKRKICTGTLMYQHAPNPHATARRSAPNLLR